MHDTGKKVGYLKGLLEGAAIDENTPQGKLIAGIVDVLNDLSDRADVIDELIDDLNDYVESIDDDLSALEDSDGDPDLNFDDEDDEDYDEDFDGAEDQLHLLRSESAQQEEESLLGSLCPECGKFFFVRMGDAQDARYVCPHCGKTVPSVPLTPENTPVVEPTE